MGKSQNVLRENMEKSQILYCPTSSDGMMFYASFQDAVIRTYHNWQQEGYGQIDFDTRMRQLQTELRDLLQQEEESKQELKELFEKLGYTL